MGRIIVLQHIGCETLGRIQAALDAEGLTYDYIRTFEGDPVPADLQDAAGLIVMGGPMGVYEQDRYPFLRQEMTLIESAFRRRLPLLGICLGSQLLAAALGSTVTKGKQREIGWYPVELTPAGIDDQLWKGAPGAFTAYHWHGDVFDLPGGAENLASSALTPHQAFRYGANAYGILFHMEVTQTIVREMVHEFSGELREAGHSGEEIIRQTAAYLPHMHTIGDHVFRRWAQLAVGASTKTDEPFGQRSRSTQRREA